ncbi:MAG: plasmid pRiA4b ORF-3 family protein [Pseudomonadales bacterium]|nr:plasmid pRiA4b ORF-3 family protein [Pseudomonadales bacterium]
MPASLYQFKVTLNGSGPAIWRRILVRNCTLDKFHEHIQTAMGWTNSSLYQFEIDDRFFSDPDLLIDDPTEIRYDDSTTTRLSDLLPEDDTVFHFLYEYDFGDCWVHEITFEGYRTPEPKKHYPQCIGGERACPPEKVGGIWGYDEFLESLEKSRPLQDELVAGLRKSFDPDAFDATKSTRRMRRGIGGFIPERSGSYRRHH